MESEHEEWIASLQDVTLPEWFQACLPEPTPAVTISWDENGGDTPFVVSDPTVDSQTSYETIEAAYDSTKTDGRDVIFDESIDGHGCTLSMGCVCVDSTNQFTRALFSVTDEDRVAILKSSYKEWLENVYPAYKRDPSNLLKAYYFVSNHPAFWTRRTGEPTFSWDTSGYVRKIWHGLSTDSEGRPVWMLEGGGHVEPEYTSHYHDLRLDAYGETFEVAVVNFAALVDKFFNIDGTPKEDVEYEPSQLELLLKERIEEVNRDQAEWEKESETHE